MKIVFFFRRKLPEFNSIEELFNSITEELKSHIQIEKIELPYSNFDVKSVFQNLNFVKKQRGKINHITGHVNYIALMTGKRTVLTIHDVKSAFYGNIFHQIIIKTLMYWLPAIFVKKITVISNFSKIELESIIPFAKSKIKVIYNPVGKLFQSKNYSFNTQYPTILCLGTKENKNLERIIKSLNGMNCRLHIIGKLSKDQLLLLDEYNTSYINSFNLSQKEIVASYESCDLLCFPSTYEGFGMPIIEAQAIGRPVVTSNIGAMLEIAENSACLVDPFDLESIRTGIENVVANEKYRNELIQRGFENIKKFQIEAIVDEYIKVYEDVLNS